MTKRTNLSTSEQPWDVTSHRPFRSSHPSRNGSRLMTRVFNRLSCMRRKDECDEWRHRIVVGLYHTQKRISRWKWSKKRLSLCMKSWGILIKCNSKLWVHWIETLNALMTPWTRFLMRISKYLEIRRKSCSKPVVLKSYHRLGLPVSTRVNNPTNTGPSSVLWQV